MMAFPKHPRVKDEKHLKIVRQMSCVACGKSGPSEPHHPLGAKWHTGKGLKASDDTVIPLCRKCHNYYHQFGIVAFEQLYGTHVYLLDRVYGKLHKENPYKSLLSENT